MSCKCDSRRIGTNYEKGVFVTEPYYCAYGCLEWCSQCKPSEYQTQTVKHCKRDGRCWQGGWNPSNANMPLSVTTVVPLSVKEIPKIGYKFITEDLLSYHGRKDRTPWKIGKAKYVSNKNPIQSCIHGFHSSDLPSSAYIYVSKPIVMKVERLGQMIDDHDDPQKVVSRGLKPIAIAWVEDITYGHDIFNDNGERLISVTKFDELIKDRLECSNPNIYNQMVRKLGPITKVRDELARHLKLPIN